MNIKERFKRRYKREDKNYITIQELMEMINKLDNVTLLDVRSVQEYEEGHLPGSMNFPLYEIERHAEKIVPDLNSIVIVYCQSGNRSEEAIRILKKKGYVNLYSLAHGLDGI